MDSLRLVTGTADPAFVSNHKGRLVVWNKAAERLLGYAAAEVLGKPCHKILCGVDAFGNLLCQAHCAVKTMVRLDQPIHTFEAAFCTASGRKQRVSVCVIVLREESSTTYNIVHLLHPPHRRLQVDELITNSNDIANSCAEFQDWGDPGLQKLSALTDREREVLKLLATGADSRQIATRLFISRRTARNHVQSILGKLDVHSRLEAIVFLHNHASDHTS